MAKFQLISGTPPRVSGGGAQRVRIGTISLFALIIIISLAVLTVLAFSTANASFLLAQRQATAMTELYLDERAAQEFVANVDALLAEARASEGDSQAGSAGVRVVESNLQGLCAKAREVSGGRVQVSAEVNGQEIRAEFACDNGRTLSILIVVRDNGTYRIDKWKMSAVQNEEPVQGQLLITD